MISNKKWGIVFIFSTIILLVGLGAVTIIIDPYFHYHAPLNNLQYPIYDERYQNDGIVKNFNYDAIITGTSTTENFKTSEFDELFNMNSVKVPFSGATYREIGDNLKRAIDANPNIKCVLRGVDAGRLIDGKDNLKYNDLPDYLYDKCFYNDVYYIFNKEILLKGTLDVLKYTDAGKKTTDFDDYGNWMKNATFGKKEIENTYKRLESAEKMVQMSDENYETMYGNVTQNIVDVAVENPQITFYLYWSPYSIYYWDSLKQTGTLIQQLEAQKAATELILECDNIFFFSFYDEYDMICNPDNYKDVLHFREEINSQILRWIYIGEHLLTKDNYEEHYRKIYEYYMNYNYASLWE